MDAPDTLDILVDEGGHGAWNMAVDHALMDRARDGAACLRFYRWDPPCLSLGRNQRARGRYDGSGQLRPGTDVVRRPTGGRAVYHHREVTYAVAAPDGLWGGLRESYRRINAALARGLRELGVPVAFQEERGRSRAPGPSARACFRDPLPGEVVVDGRKLVGSAQWRNDGALLQHGSILLDDDQERAEAQGPAGGSEDSGATSLASCLDQLPSHHRLQEALVRGFVRELGLPERELADSTGLRRRARDHVDLYSDEEWTWRR